MHLGRVAALLVLHKARVGVVLEVFALDEALHAEEAPDGPRDDFVQLRGDEVDLLGGVAAVVEVAEQLGIHLELDIVVVDLQHTSKGAVLSQLCVDEEGPRGRSSGFAC